MTLNLGYEQVFPLPNGASIAGNVGRHYESSYWLDYTHSQIFPGKQPDIWKTDVSLTYRAPGNHWNISGWARNLENAPVYSAFAPAALKSAGVIVGANAIAYIDDPRTYGVRVGVNF